MPKRFEMHSVQSIGTTLVWIREIPFGTAAIFLPSANGAGSFSARIAKLFALPVATAL
jgi:hypothetical protein